MTSTTLSWQKWFLIAAVVTGIFLVAWNRKASAAPSEVTISTPRTFASLDGSALDADLAANGVFTVDGRLTIADGGSITCNDDAPLAKDDSACSIELDVHGDFIVETGGAVFAENRRAGGSGGDIIADVGGNFSMGAGAIVSVRRTSSTGKSRERSAIAMHVAGDVSVARGAEILADSPDEAGVIAITGSIVDIDGVVSSLGAATTGRGGAISVVASRTLTIPAPDAVRSRGIRTLIPLPASASSDVDLYRPASLRTSS